MLRAVCFVALVATALAAPHLPKLVNGRVVNGTDAPAGKYPSQVSLLSGGSHNCGGSIINENWVLTAAHCVYYESTFNLEILAGTVTLNNGGNVHSVTEIIYHENYDTWTIENDVAIVRVDPPFVWSDMVQPVTLPTQNLDTPSGSDATLIGWGLDETGGNIMNHLQEVDYWTVSDDECQAVHSSTVFSTNICAYYPGGGKGQCSGDSGGPLFINQDYQAGIVSWSVKPCTVAPYPGVFTQVSSYIDWINSHMN